MSNRTKNIGTEAGISRGSRNALNLASWRRQDSGSSAETERTTPQPIGLETWIKKFDDEKAATGSGTPSILSAFSRITYTPAPAAQASAGSTVTLPQTRPTLPSLSAEPPKISKRSARIPSRSDLSSLNSTHGPEHQQIMSTFPPGLSIPQPTSVSGLGISYPSTPFTPPSGTKTSARPLAPFSSYVPPKVEHWVPQIAASEPLPSSHTPSQKTIPSNFVACQSRPAPFPTSSAPYPSPFTDFVPLE